MWLLRQGHGHTLWVIKCSVCRYIKYINEYTRESYKVSSLTCGYAHQHADCQVRGTVEKHTRTQLLSTVSYRSNLTVKQKGLLQHGTVQLRLHSRHKQMSPPIGCFFPFKLQRKGSFYSMAHFTFAFVFVTSFRCSACFFSSCFLISLTN